MIVVWGTDAHEIIPVKGVRPFPGCLGGEHMQALLVESKISTFFMPSETSIWRAFSPKWVSGFIRPLHSEVSVIGSILCWSQ